MAFAGLVFSPSARLGAEGDFLWWGKGLSWGAAPYGGIKRRDGRWEVSGPAGVRPLRGVGRIATAPLGPRDDEGWMGGNLGKRAKGLDFFDEMHYDIIDLECPLF